MVKQGGSWTKIGDGEVSREGMERGGAMGRQNRGKNRRICARTARIYARIGRICARSMQ